MPSNYLPPMGQRPRMISRVDLSGPKSNNVDQIAEREAENGVLNVKSQVVERSSEASTPRFPHESQAAAYRGELSGRNLRQGANPEQLSGLSERVSAFGQFKPIGPRLSSLGSLEKIALGLDETTSETSADQGKLNGESSTEEARAISAKSDPQTDAKSEEQSVGQSSTENKEADPDKKKPNGESLSREEIREVEQLKKRDAEVRQHEQAHVSAGGQHIRGGISYDYSQGPNGKRYVTSGEVSIDLSPESTPQATISKMRQVRRAALAPAQPSGADRAAAAAASQTEAEARSQLAKERSEEVKKGSDSTRAKLNQEQSSQPEPPPTQPSELTQTPATQGAPEQRSLRHHESYPLSSSHESYPLSSSHESYPLSSSHESYPLSSSHESYPLSSSHESYPLSSNHESYPLSSNHESYPLSSSHESYPLSSNHESHPLSSHDH